MLRTVWRRARAQAPLLAAVYVPATGFLLATLVASRLTGMPFGVLTREPTLTMGAHPLTGMVSSIGVLGWCAAATVILFTWGVTRARAVGPVGDAFLLIPGLLTVVLALDDLFEIHERLMPEYVVGPDDLLIPFYALIVAGWLVAFRRRILRTEYLLLLAAGVGFVVSVVVDRVSHAPYDSRYLVEDGGKFLGIFGWLGYFARVCFRQLAGR